MPRFTSFLGRLLLFAPLVFALAALVTAGIQSVKSVPVPQLGSLQRSILQIQANWSGKVTVPFKSGPVTYPVSETAYCTAWVVGSNAELATSSHCVRDTGIRNDLINEAFMQMPFNESPLTSPTKWKVTGATALSSDVEVVWTKQLLDTIGMSTGNLYVEAIKPLTHGDIALLKGSNELKKIPALPIATSDPAIGSPLTSIGYPGGMMQAVDKYTMGASFTGGKVSGYQRMSSGGFKVTEVSSPLGAGMSGGPTVDQYGNVLGLNMAQTDYQPLNLITDAGDLRKFMVQHGVQLAPVSTTLLSSQSGETRTVMSLSGPNIIVWVSIIIALLCFQVYILASEHDWRREE